MLKVARKGELVQGLEPRAESLSKARDRVCEGGQEQSSEEGESLNRAGIGCLLCSEAYSILCKSWNST